MRRRVPLALAAVMLVLPHAAEAAAVRYRLEGQSGGPAAGAGPSPIAAEGAWTSRH